MLSIGKLAGGPAAGRYYVEQVAQGREDYYAGEGEAEGAWLGSGAASLSVRGTVDAGGLARLLDGRHPATDGRLRRPLEARAVAGYDLTFRAPKSVSLLFGIAEPDIARRVVRAHERAVAQALSYLEGEAVRGRRGRGGAVIVPGNGLVAAAFRHRSSRAGDPLLHTHVVVGNLTQGPDGRWTALDGRFLYRHAKTAGYLYQAVLRDELTRDLCVRWLPVENGVADIDGVPRRVIEHFSQRRAEILELMGERGEHSARAAQVATLQTRRRKEYGVPVDRLREDWRARAAEHGLDRWRLQRVLGRRPRSVDEDLFEHVAARLESSSGLTRDRSIFTKRDVVQAFAEAAGSGASAAEARALAARFLTRDSIVELTGDGLEPTYSTRELLGLERQLLDRGRMRRREGVGIARDPDVAAAIARRPTLSREQRELVRTLTSSGDGVEVVLAAAGTGKTFALDAAREAWQASGRPVIGCALSARAAAELRDQAGLDATTIASLRLGLERGLALAEGAVIILDEAGMVGTRDLATLTRAAEHSRAKLVLVGDDRQLPEIEAGGAFRALSRELGARELHQVRRQRDGWDRLALGALRQGDVEQFAQEYERHGRLIAASSAEAARSRLVEDWWQAHAAGADALMIAYRRADVADLNRRAREHLRIAGRLGPDLIETDDRGFGLGDRVVATRNVRALDIFNGQVATITAVAEDRVTLARDDGRELELPLSYVTDGHLDHGYALTAHRAQGATVDRAFVLGSDELYREWGYAALSRHREAAHFYVSASPSFLNELPPALEPSEAGGHVARMLEASRAEQLALSGLRGDPARDSLAAELVRARERAADAWTQLQVLEDEREQTPWFQRAQRRELARTIAGCERTLSRCHDDIFRLEAELEGRPQRREPRVLRAIDPLSRLRRRERVLERPARHLTDDFGIGL